VIKVIVTLAIQNTYESSKQCDDNMAEFSYADCFLDVKLVKPL